MAENQWNWWAGRDEEWLTVGPCSTRDDVIAEAKNDIGEGEGDFVIMEAIMEVLPPPSADTVLDNYFEYLAENVDYFSSEHDTPEWGANADDQRAATAELQDAINTWFAKWSATMPTPNMFNAMRNRETISNTVDPDMLPGGHDNPREPE